MNPSQTIAHFFYGIIALKNSIMVYKVKSKIFDTIHNRFSSLIHERSTKQEGIMLFLAELEQSGPLYKFDEAVWYDSR